MSHPVEPPPLQNFVSAMKRDWDDRAREDARWYINTVRRGQTEAEFDATCVSDIECFILADLAVLTGGRDPRSLRMLEIGCGIGRMTRHLAGIFGEVYGTDVSGEMIRQGRERLKDYSNIHLDETSGCDFSEFPDDYFDLIFSAYVFQHIPDAEVIRANIRDGYRVLRPGGVFKFMAAGITHADYAKMPKDTWTGAAFSEPDSRRIAQELDAQLLGVIGNGTQYFWTLLRKPLPGQKRTTAIQAHQPEIISAGRADDLSIGEIPARGDLAWLGLTVSGISMAESDCNSLVVEFRGRDLLPVYIGPVGIAPDQVQMNDPEKNQGERLQVNLRIPADDPGGPATVRLRLSDGMTSNLITARILSPQQVPPKVTLISNAFDGGLDLFARGPKSLVRIFVDGLDESASTDNVIVHIGERAFKPQSLTFQPNNAVYLLTVQLPEDTLPQETSLCVRFGGLQSPGSPIRIS